MFILIFGATLLWLFAADSSPPALAYNLVLLTAGALSAELGLNVLTVLIEAVGYYRVIGGAAM